MPEKRKKFKPKRIQIVAVLAVLALGAAVFAFAHKKINDEEVQKGRAWLAREEAVNYQSSAAEIIERQSKTAADERQEYEKSLDEEGKKIWEQFSDYALLGDFRTSGFSWYDYLDEQRVFYSNAGTIREITGFLDKLKKLNPEIVFLTYGLNDCASGLWETPAAYAKEYLQIVNELQDALPQAGIVVTACPEAGPNAAKIYSDISAYNNAVKQIMTQNDKNYLDNSNLSDEHKDLITQDGIHFEPEFYPFWGKSLLMGQFDVRQKRQSPKGGAADDQWEEQLFQTEEGE